MGGGWSGWVEAGAFVLTIATQYITRSPMKSELAESNVHMRMQDRKLDVIDRAARSLGVNRTQFMTGASFDKATDVLLDQPLVQANSKSFNEILEWLCVCSDEGVGKNDDIAIHTQDIGIPCVTNKKIIAA